MMCLNPTAGVGAEAKSVLIVEDDDDLREAARESIAAEGLPTAAAANGKEAVEYLEHATRPGAIVLDLMMPVMNGWDLLRWLAKRPHLADVPVIIISAARECERSRKLHPGVAYCLSKPFALDTLLWALGRVCPPRRGGDE